jgi:hypothetical protein
MHICKELIVNSTLELVAPLIICNYQNTVAKWNNVISQTVGAKMPVNICATPWCWTEEWFLSLRCSDI